MTLNVIMRLKMIENTDNTFSARVKSLRKKQGMTQIDLAEASGLSQTTIADIERGRNVSSRSALQIADALGCTVKHLISGGGWHPTIAEASAIAMWMDGRNARRLELQGKRPDQYKIVGDNLIIATIDHENNPSLEVFTLAEALDAIKRLDIWVNDGRYGYYFEVYSEPYKGDWCSFSDFMNDS